MRGKAYRLRGLDNGYRFRSPMPIRVWHDILYLLVDRFGGKYIAEPLDSSFIALYGVGSTREEAIRDLGIVLAYFYNGLLATKDYLDQESRDQLWILENIYGITKEK